jgi:hypothetical protein
LLTDHGEEHLQVVSNGEHCVRPTLASHEPQVVVQHRHTQPQLRLSSTPLRTDHAHVERRWHSALLSSPITRYTRGEMSMKITGISSMSGRRGS